MQDTTLLVVASGEHQTARLVAALMFFRCTNYYQ